MPILVQTIVDRCNSFLDAEGSDRYKFDRDYIFAINSSIEWITGLINSNYSIDKFPSEYLKELTKIKVFKTSNKSRIFLNETVVGHSIWTILSVYPKITFTGSLTTQPNPNISIYCPNAVFKNSNKSAKRMTIEQWNKKNDNILLPGSTYFQNISDDFVEYSFLDFMTFDTNPEIEIAPSILQEPVAISYLKMPTPITAITDNIEFPLSLTDLFVQKTLNYISIKNSEPALKQLTDSNIANLIKIFM